MKKTTDNKNLTKMPISKAIFVLAVPIILANVLSTVYNLTDTFWVGRLGADAVAAVSVSFPIIFVLLSVASGLTSAGSILVAQYKGRQDQKQVDYISAQAFSIVFLAAIGVSILGYFTADVCLGLFNLEPAVFSQAVSYLKISYIGLAFVFLFMTYESLMRGVGDVKTPTLIVLGSVLLNLIVDPLFIYGWKFIPAYGVGGAAVATAVTQSLAAFIGIGYLFLSKKNKIKLSFLHIKPKLEIVKRFFKLGLPTSVETAARAFSFLILTVFITKFGTTILAAYGLGGRIFSFVIIPAVGFAIANSILVGQNLGAGNKPQALQTSRRSLGLAMIALTSIGILLYIFAKPLSAAFVPGEVEVIEKSAQLIHFLAFCFTFIGIQMVSISSIRAAGQTTMSMMLTVLGIVLLIAVAYILLKVTDLGYLAVYWAYPISNIITAIIAYLVYNRKKWLDNNLLSD